MKFNIDKQTQTLVSIEDIDKSEIEKLEIPENIRIIGEDVIAYLANLKEITFPKSLKIISDGGMFCCKSIEKIEIPEGVEELGNYIFSKCYNLKKVTLPSTLKKIGELSFCESKNLENIEMPDSVENIGEYAFHMCSKLKTVKLSSSLKMISAFLFAFCENLEKIEMPQGIESIGDSSFYKCKKIKEIKLPNSLKTIGSRAFNGCSNLENIEIPEGVLYMEKDVFFKCDKLKKITIKNLNCLNNNSLEINIAKFENFYINKQNGELICSKEEIDNLVGYKKIDLEEIEQLQTNYSYNRSEALIVMLMIENEKFEKLGNNIKYILPQIMKYYDLNEFTNERKDMFSYCDKFNNLLKQIKKITDSDIKDHKIEYENIFNVAYTLGAFNDDEVERQTACEFIATAFQQGYFDMHSIHGMFEMLKPIDYSRELRKEWSSFLRNKKNFKELIELEKEQSGYITQIYKSFEQIKEYGRKSNGSQEYRDVTLDICKEYFAKVYFGNVEEKDYDIVEELLKYNDLKNQETFDDAVSIREQYLKSREKGEIDDHILKEELKEKDIFEQIEEDKISILNGTKEVLELLDEIAEKKFTYEFLSKCDLKNLSLGKYCSCCAHLAGAGYGIMKASILHPNCQNLIIRDSKGNIVAKSTLYINRKQGYGVFNNVEVNNSITDKEELDLIYKKYMKAIDDFVTRYNEVNKKYPLTQINVGMSLNDLEERFKINNEEASEILQGLNFSDYGKVGQSYNGDWQKAQRVVWQKKDKKK